MSKCDIRKEAYRYIQEILSKLPVCSCDADQGLTIPLDELIQLKEGVTDPSVMLVATFKRLFRGTATEAEIDTHLVKPFQEEKGIMGK
jgi:AmiR/NasT family two-component response regulator